MIGDEEVKNGGTVNVRTRDGDVMGESQTGRFYYACAVNMKSFK